MDHAVLILSKVELLKIQIYQSLAWVGKFVRTGKWKAVGDHTGKKQCHELLLVIVTFHNASRHIWKVQNSQKTPAVQTLTRVSEL